MASAEALGRPARVVLASMPFGVLYSPSLALGILQARLADAGIETACRHFTIDYAARIGVKAYNSIARGFPNTTSLLGEWIFSHALGSKSTAQQEAYLVQVLGEDEDTPGRATDTADQRLERELRIKTTEQILLLAAGAGDFVDYAAREILARAPQVVGLTSVFEQNLASIALAHCLRSLSPSLTIIMGGANCEGDMGRELARRYPFIDLVVSGEADLVIAPLVSGLLRGEHWKANEGLRPIVDMRVSTDSFLQTRMVASLADQPRPEFDSYFENMSQHPSVAAKVDIEIPMESSRGCWWGEKHHCTFCGLNGATMAFRSKAPEAVVQDIQAYAAKYPGRKISFVDNIMDHKYFSSLLPELTRLAIGVDFFYELKSNVTKAQVRALRHAGVRRIQPGIESLSDRVLALMKKGVTAIQNLELLKWCMEFGVRVDWNVLWGFPGESPADYEAMARTVPWLVHLEPPTRGSHIRLDRFSPNYSQAESFGFRRVRPFPSYSFVYDGLPAEAVGNLAYFFQADHDLDAEIDRYTLALKEAIRSWHQAHPRSKLFYLEHAGRVVLVDTRMHHQQREFRELSQLASRLVTLCDGAQSISTLARALPGIEPEPIRRELEELCQRGIIWTDGRRFLSLAVSFTTYLESRRGARLEEGLDRMLSGHWD
jgi:ribosomal peptide maturation radical SAM protein 1